MGPMKVLLATLLVASATFAQTPPKAAPKGAPTKSGTPTKTGAPAAPRPNPLLTPSSLTRRAPETFHVKLATTHGDIVIECHRDWAPIGVDRFYNLVRNGFFTNAAFFRYVPNFIVQFGMNANPAISKVWANANIKDDPVTHGNKEGTVVFATAGANTRTTQLFINFKDNGPSLDGQGFAAFGTVTEGLDVAKGLYAGYGESPEQGRITNEGKAYLDRQFPKLDYIKTATIVPEPGAAPAAAPATKTGAPATKSATPPAPPKK